jgi:heat-inducible transcriptional repressor
MLPRRNVATLRQVEFLPLSENRVLVILVLNGQEVQNRIIQTQRSYSAAELQQAAHYLNEQFTGKDIQQVRECLLRDLRETRDSLDRLMQTVVEMAEQTFETEPDGEDYVVAGQTHLMQYADLSDLDKLRQLFEAFNHKRDLLHLLDQCLRAEGVQIFIGEESGFEVLENCSVVTAPYSVAGQVLGVLGVIGPTRMAYDRVIPVVDVTARLLAAALIAQRV